MALRVFQTQMGGQPPKPPEVFSTKRIRYALTLTLYSWDAEQAEAPMAVPEESVPLSNGGTERRFSFGLNYLGGDHRSGAAPPFVRPQAVSSNA